MGMFENYPPGVTGHEHQIAGGRDGGVVEVLITHECPEPWEPFTGEVEADREFHDFVTMFYWTCPRCGRDGETEEDMDPRDFEDPDRGRDD